MSQLSTTFRTLYAWLALAGRGASRPPLGGPALRL